MSMKNFRISNKLITTVLLSLLSLSSGITGTLAWFTANRKVSVEAGSFEVTTPEGQDADLYYHTLNYNQTLKKYAGFEKASLTDDNYSCFKKVTDSNTDSSPTNTSYLWPNFQLSYALVFKPIRTGTYTFKLKSWKSEESKDKLVEEGKGIKLSWAIKMYAYADKVEDDKNLFSSAESYFKSTNTDDFFKDKDDETKEQSGQTYEVSDTSKFVVVYFSIEFSNDSSTYYEKNETDVYWCQKNDSSTQSMCYENLTFNVQKFVLDIPSDVL